MPPWCLQRCLRQPAKLTLRAARPSCYISAESGTRRRQQADNGRSGTTLWATSKSGFSTVDGGGADGPAAQWQTSLQELLEVYRNYRNAAATRPPAAPGCSTDLKKQLKAAAREAAKHVEHCDIDTATALMACLVHVSRRCKCVELYSGLLRLLLHALRSRGDQLVTQDNRTTPFDFGSLIETPRLEGLRQDEALAALLLRSLRLYELRNTPKPLLDDVFTVVNSNMYRWSPDQLVEVCRDLAWVCRFCERERFSGLLRKSIALLSDCTSKTKTTLSRMQLIAVIRALSVVKQDAAPLASRVNHLVSALLAAEQGDSPSDIQEKLTLHYRRAKGNVHLLHVALISGIHLDAAVVHALIDGVMQFCTDYFAATCRVWQMKSAQPNAHDYNTIDPRVANLLYAKCANKVVRLPGSLDPDHAPRPRAPKLEERYQAVVAALSRLLEGGKLAFCRGLKSCEARLRVSNRNIYDQLDDAARSFMKAVACFRLGEPRPAPSDGMARALRHLGYRPVPLMVDGAFQVNCIDHRRRLFCDLCNDKEARPRPGGGAPVYNAATELKLRCLEAAGWRGATVLQAEWRRLPEEGRVALLRAKLATIDKHA
ncbi:CobQ/CobB/MinD/ParA nucleotide binding domain-containing protein [Babesia caballi]|uniref:CobQ/CobB/MinD/ParA nucleotide binding domain-containing protein n=1 Tax=Babesia caballi TaxID=5871 RepID=A0AAV4LRS6_BABCB|nr:CobQ/CobB/MinD/ParA nucleotide binding domain-containing protein [Babesia caballi]